MSDTGEAFNFAVRVYITIALILGIVIGGSLFGLGWLASRFFAG